MHKFGVIGDKDSVQCFIPLGIDAFPVTDEPSVRETFNKLVEEKYAIIYITEHAAALIIELINSYSDAQLPAVIPIPSTKGVLGMGKLKIKRAVERAVGADILFKEDN